MAQPPLRDLRPTTRSPSSPLGLLARPAKPDPSELVAGCIDGVCTTLTNA